MVRTQRGDSAAYEALLRELGGRLRAYFRRRLSAIPDDVEDLLQETMLAIHNQRHTYDPSQPFTAWVYAIARYKTIDLFRRRSVYVGITEPFDDEIEAALAHENDEGDARRDIATLLATLPDRQRLPIQQVKLQGLSVAESARLTGMSESAVKVGIHRGLKALAAKVQGKP